MNPSPDAGRLGEPGLRDWRREADQIIEAERTRLTEQRLGGPIVRVVRAGSRNEWLAHMAGQRDSSSTMICSTSADLVILMHPYRSGRAMDAWITSLPKDGVLEIEVLITPTWPKATSARQGAREQFRQWAETNRYKTRITLPTGWGPESHVSAAADMTINSENCATHTDQSPIATALNVGCFNIGRYGSGRIKIEAWPDGSSGVKGYVERRRTNLYV